MDLDARAFGQLEGEVKALREMMSAQNETLAAQNTVIADMSTKVSAISTTLAEARGGWKTLVFIGGAAASVATAVTWILQHLSFKGTP